MARDILEGNRDIHFFDLLHGAYGQHPASASFFQAWIMLPFGISIFSWRLVSVISTFLMAIPSYLICREIFSRKVGLILLFMILFSHYWYIWAFSGYNNICGVFPIMYSTYFLIKYLKNKGLGYLILSGMFSGFGWYLHTLSVLGIGALLGSVMFFSGKSFKEKIKICFIIGISCLITIWPLIGHITIEENFHFIFKNAQSAKDVEPLVFKLERQFFLAFVNSIFDLFNARSHWIVGCATDVCCSFFMLIGIFVTAWRKNKNASLNVLFGILFLLWIAICLSNTYYDFPNTRVMYLLIFWQIFASTGIVFFVESILNTNVLKKLTYFSLILLSFSINFSLGKTNAFIYSSTGMNGNITLLSKEDFHLANIYGIGNNPNPWINNIIFYDGYNLKNNIMYDNYEKIKIPNKLRENEAVAIDIINRDILGAVLNKYQNQNIQAIYRENRINKGKIIIVANRKKIDEILERSPADKFIAYKILS